MHSEILNTIHITAWTIEVKILRYRRERDKDEYEARLEQDLGIWNHLGVVVNWLLGACKMLGACKLHL